MRWTLSNGEKIESANSKYAYSNRVPRFYKWYYGAEYNYYRGYERALIKLANGELSAYHKKIETVGSCAGGGERFESGEVYAWLTTAKIFHEMPYNTAMFTGQKMVSGWKHQLITAFGYTPEELKKLPSYWLTENGWMTKMRYWDWYQGTYTTGIESTSANVFIGTYNKNVCTNESNYDLADPLPFPDFGTDEVLYEISYTGAKGNVSWTLKLD